MNISTWIAVAGVTGSVLMGATVYLGCLWAKLKDEGERAGKVGGEDEGELRWQQMVGGEVAREDMREKGFRESQVVAPLSPLPTVVGRPVARPSLYNGPLDFGADSMVE